MKKYKNPPSMHTIDFKTAEMARKNGKLLEISLMVPGPCDLQCRYCFTEHEQTGTKTPKIKKYEPFTFKEIIPVLEEALSLGLCELQYVGVGEPILCRNGGPFFWDLTEWLRSNNVTVTVFTNGIQIAENPDIAKKLFEMDVNVVSKLNSMNPRINDRLVGKTGAYRTFGKALDNLIEAGYTSVNNPKLGVHSIICRSNLLSIPKMWIEFREKNIIPYFQVLIPPKNINNKFYRELKVSPIALKNLFNRILEIDRKQFGFDWVPTPPLIGMDCQKSKYGVGIDAFLNVAICAFSLKHLGNIREVKRDCSKKPLTKILSLDAVNKIRWTRKFCDGKCGTCEHPFCQGGCRAAAQNAAEMIYDVTAEDNITCWYKGKYGEFDFIKKG